jgi:hypothetical protein
MGERAVQSRRKGRAGVCLVRSIGVAVERAVSDRELPKQPL